MITVDGPLTRVDTKKWVALAAVFQSVSRHIAEALAALDMPDTQSTVHMSGALSYGDTATAVAGYLIGQAKQLLGAASAKTIDAVNTFTHVALTYDGAEAAVRDQLRAAGVSVLGGTQPGDVLSVMTLGAISFCDLQRVFIAFDPHNAVCGSVSKNTSSAQSLSSFFTNIFLRSVAFAAPSFYLLVPAAYMGQIPLLIQRSLVGEQLSSSHLAGLINGFGVLRADGAHSTDASSWDVAASLARGINDGIISVHGQRQLYLGRRGETLSSVVIGREHGVSVGSGGFYMFGLAAGGGAAIYRGITAVTATGSPASATVTAAARISRSRIAPPLGPVALIDQISDMDSSPDYGLIRVLEHHGRGRSTWTVAIRGTQVWGLDTKNPQNLQANLAMVAGLPSMQERAVVKAMESAGIKPGDTVEFVGHSQGGIAAARLAGDPLIARRYRVTNALTFGAPNSHIRTGTDVLRVENSYDPVPALDGKMAAREGITVVSSDRVVSSKTWHDLENYRGIAQQIEDSNNRDLSSWMERRRRALGLDTATHTTVHDFVTYVR